MRLYSFGNMYLLGIQAGIQCQHCTAELFTKYTYICESGFIEDHEETDTHNLLNLQLMEWATDHKTTILLNGGMQSDLRDIISHFQKQDNPYPWEYFRESHDALNAALTNVSIVLPEKIYMYKKLIEEVHSEISDDGRTVEVFREEGMDGSYDPGFVVYSYTKWELELIELINSKRLMS